MKNKLKMVMAFSILIISTFNSYIYLSIHEYVMVKMLHTEAALNSDQFCLVPVGGHCRQVYLYLSVAPIRLKCIKCSALFCDDLIYVDKTIFLMSNYRVLSKHLEGSPGGSLGGVIWGVTWLIIVLGLT